jgi:hypothetical protein
MKENQLETAKSVILAVHVVASVFLTGYMWFGFPGRYVSGEPTSGMEVAVRSDVNPRDFLMPSRIASHYGNGAFSLWPRGTPGYDEAWNEGRPLTLVMGELAGTAGGDEADRARRQGVGIEFMLAVALPFSQWLDYMGIEAPAGWDFPTSRFFLTTAGNRAFVRTSPGSYKVINLMVDAQVLKEALTLSPPGPGDGAWLLPGEAAGVGVSDGVFLPVASPEAAALSLEAEAADVQAILAGFFVDPSVVRRIEERDGAIIYTDGSIGLRVYPWGGLEYATPFTDIGPEFPNLAEALRKSVDFVAQHGSWPENPFLTSWSPTLLGGMAEGLSLRFSYTIDSRPVISSGFPLEVSVGGQEVAGYRRNVLCPVGEQHSASRVIRPLDAIRAVVDGQDVRLEGTVTDVYLGYWVKAGEDLKGLAVPVWVVTMEGDRPVLVDAHTGSIVDIRER